MKFLILFIISVLCVADSFAIGVGALSATGAGISLVASMTKSEKVQKAGAVINIGIGGKLIASNCPTNLLLCGLGAAHIYAGMQLFSNADKTRRNRDNNYGREGSHHHHPPIAGHYHPHPPGPRPPHPIPDCAEGGDNTDCVTEDPTPTPPDPIHDDPLNCVADADNVDCDPNPSRIVENCINHPQQPGCRVIIDANRICRESAVCDLTNLPLITLPNGDIVDVTTIKNPLSEQEMKDLYDKALSSAQSSYPNLFSDSSMARKRKKGSSTSDVAKDKGLLDGDGQGGASSRGGPIVIRRNRSPDSLDDDGLGNDWYKKLQAQLNNKKKKKTLKFKSQKLGNDKIGTSYDNIFNMMSEGYQARY